MNWRAATGVLVIILLIAPVVSVSAQETMSNDEYEPNDEISSATDISPGEYTGLQLVSDENDYYAISVDEGETLNITATYPYQSDGEVADNEPALELVDSNGETLDYGEDDSDPVDDYKTDHLGYESDANQTLYILVTGYTDAETSSSYDLTVETNTAEPDSPSTSEPTPADTATPVPDTDTPVSTQTSVYTTANEFSEETDTEYDTSQSTTMADDPEGGEPTSGSAPGFGIGITIITLATVILISLPRLE